MHTSDEPGQGEDDVGAFGWRDRAVARYVRRIRWPRPRAWGLWAAAALTGSLAGLAVGGGTPSHPAGKPPITAGGGTQSHPAGKPVTSIAIQNANTTDFVLNHVIGPGPGGFGLRLVNGHADLFIAVEYLRVGRSTSDEGLPVLPLAGGTTWVTVVVTGLPAGGPVYMVTAGECSHGRAVSLGEPSSGRAGPAGVLSLQVANVPVPFDSSRFWIQISAVPGQSVPSPILAEIRGPIWPPVNGRLIALGTPICRAA
jgi:hypothetical protein